MQKLIVKLGTMMASLALFITTANANSTCVIVIHQPKLPDSAKKLRKF